MKKQGFTLVELISVIVILAVISVITVPLVASNIDSTRIKSYTVGVNNVMDALNKYLADHMETVEMPKEGIQVPNNNIYKRLALKNADYTQGLIIKNSEGVLEVKNLSNGVYCASGTKNNLKVVKGNCTKLDATPPTVNLTSGRVTSNTITVVVNGQDEDSNIVEYVYYLAGQKIDTTKINSYTFKNLSPNKSYVIKVEVTDGNGNKATGEKVITTKESDITIKEMPTSWSRAKTVTIEFPEKNDSEKYRYMINNGNYEYTSDRKVTINLNNKATITAQVVTENNIAVISKTKAFNNIDITDPSIISIDGNSSSWTTSKKIIVNAKDIESGIQAYSFDGGKTWQKENYKVFSKNQTVNIVVQDNVGNTSNGKIELTKIDPTIPGAFKITAEKTSGDYTSGVWVNESVTLYANPNPSETLSGYYYQWYEVIGTSGSELNLSIISGATGRTYTVTQNVNKTYVVKVTTGANVGPKQSDNKINVRIDKIAPGCNWIGESSTWTKSSRTISLICNDQGGSGCLGSTSNNSWPYTSGTHRTEWLTFTIRDGAGNVTACSKTADVYVDKDAPTCNAFTGESTTWTNSNRTISGSASDSGSGTSSKFSKTYNSGTTKTAEVSFVAKDNVGNTTTCKKTANVYVDKEGPKLSNLKNDSKGNWTNKDFSVSYSVTDSGVGYDHCEYNYDYDRFNSCGGSSWCVDTGTYSNGTFTTSFSAERNTTAKFKCYDKLGNASNVISTAIKIDKTGPTITDDDSHYYNSSCGNQTTDSVDIYFMMKEDGSGIDYCKWRCENSDTSWVKDTNWSWYTASDSTWYDTKCHDPGKTLSINFKESTWSAARNDKCHYRCVDKAGNIGNETWSTINISSGSSEPEYSTDPAICSPWHNGSNAGYSCSNAVWACSYRVSKPGETSYSDCADVWGGTIKNGDDNNNIYLNSNWDPGAKLPAYCVVAKSPSGLYSVYCTSNTNQYHESTGTTSDAGCSIEYIKASDCIDDCDDNGLCESFDHQPTSCGVNISGC